MSASRASALLSRKALVALFAVVALAGCDQQASGSNSAGASPATDYTAWWKGGDTASAAATAQAPAMAGWAKLGAIKPDVAKQGGQVFTSKCASCHSIGRGQVVGPDLKGLTGRVEPDWATTFIKDPAPMLESDAHAKELLGKYLVKMPNLQLTAEQLAAVTEYLRQQDQAKP